MKEPALPIELRKTIPWRLVLIFILFSIAIILGGSFFYKSQRDRILSTNQNSLQAVSTLKIGQIEQWYSERLGDAITIRDNEPLIRTIKQYLTSGNKSGSEKEITKWMESLYSGYDYSGICILDTLLNTKLSISRFDSVKTGNIRKEISRVLQKKIIVLTDLYRAYNSGKIHIDLIIPLIDPDNKVYSLIGLLILRIDPEKLLFPLIQSWPTPSKSSETLILRRDGDSVLYLNDLRHSKNTALNLKLPLTDSKLLASKAIAGQLGVVEGIDYRNIEVVGALSRIPDFNWFMVAKIDKDEIQSPLKRFLIITLIVCILLILINASVFGGFIWSQRVKMYRMQLKDELALRESDEKLRESDTKFRQTFELSPVGIVMVGLDKKFLRCNNSFSNSLGYTVDELVGKTISDVTLPEDENIGMTEMLAIAQGQLESTHFQKRYLRIDGSIVWGDVLISLVRDNAGNPQYFLAIIQDITESKLAENEIRLQSSIMSHMGEAVYLVRLSDGIIVFANKGFEMMFGYLPGEMIGKHVSIVNAPAKKSPEETASEIIKTLKERGVWIGEVQNIKKDGTHFWTHANVTIFDLPHFGEVLISVQKDITEQKNAELLIKKLNEELEEKVIRRTGQLETANKELEAFSYSVSHDLRAPLRSVHGYTKILLEEYENKLDDEGKRICRIITSSATQMGGLIDDLLSFSRIGRSNLNPTTIDMKKLVRKLYEGMTSPVERERIVITIGKLHKSYGDVALIGQVWINLLSNAIKYSSKKEVSEISVGSEVKGEMVIYFVKDNGVGFDMEYAHKLFGVFQRLHSEREFEGNGVGLAIVQRIILKHGGKVWAEGEVGKGATFYFSLPLKEKMK